MPYWPQKGTPFMIGEVSPSVAARCLQTQILSRQMMMSQPTGGGLSMMSELAWLCTVGKLQLRVM